MTDHAPNTRNVTIVFILTMIITVSQDGWQQHLIRAETHLHINKNPPPT